MDKISHLIVQKFLWERKTYGLPLFSQGRQVQWLGHDYETYEKQKPCKPYESLLNCL